MTRGLEVKADRSRGPKKGQGGQITTTTDSTRGGKKEPAEHAPPQEEPHF